MRFCLVSTQQNWGGGETLIAAIANQLLKSGHSVGWIARDGSEVAARLENESAAILHRTTGRGHNWRDWQSVRQVLRQWSPDVIVMNDTHAVPLVGTAVWFTGRERPVRLAYKHTVFPLRSRLKYQWLTDRLICVSEAARQTVLNGGMPLEHVAVVYGGTEPPTPDPQARERIRAELALTEETTLLVSVGSLLECKGHADAIDAIHQLSDPRLVYAIAGKGPEQPRLQQQIERLNLSRQVKLLGYRDDANQLIQAADLVVHPSHSEGLSLVLIQAQMLSRPIVASAVGGAAEVLGVHEARGEALHSSPRGEALHRSSSGEAFDKPSSWICQPHSVGDLSNQLADALKVVRSPDGRQILSRPLEQTARRAERLFSIQHNSQQLVELASELLNRTATRSDPH